MPQSPELRAIVQRMIDAGESEADIGAVIQRLSPASTPDVSSQLDGPPEQTLGRVASTTWDTIKGGAESMARLSGLPGMLTGGPWNAVKQQAAEVWKMSQAHGDQYLKAKAAEREGRILPMIGHSVAAAIPVIGPWAASIGETAGSGDLAGAAGIGIGGVALAEAPAKVARGSAALARPVVRGVARAAAGASEGGVGGMVANVLRSAAPLPPKMMVTQAVKPRSNLLGFGQALDRAMPELKITEAELGRPIATLADTLEAVKLAKKRVRAQYDEIAGPRREMGSTVDLEPVAEAMIESIPKKVRLESPKVAAKMEQRAEVYRGRFDLAEAERLLLETNAELDAYYSKFPAAQRHGVAANPETAALVSQAKEMRTAIYRSLDDPGQGAAPRELNRRYGALLELEGEAQRRVNVQARQPSENLAEQISGARAVGHVVKGGYRLLRGDPMGAIDIVTGNAMRSASKFMKEQQTTDALLRRAFASYEGAPVPVEMPVAPVIRGLLPPATTRMGPSADTSGPIPPTLPENLTRAPAKGAKTEPAINTDALLDEIAELRNRREPIGPEAIRRYEDLTDAALTPDEITELVEIRDAWRARPERAIPTSEVNQRETARNMRRLDMAAVQRDLGAVERVGDHWEVPGLKTGPNFYTTEAAANLARDKALGRASSAKPESAVQRQAAEMSSIPKAERSFILRWLADEMRDLPFEESSRMRGKAAIEEHSARAYGEAATNYKPRMGGTKIQEMFHAMGIKGSRGHLAAQLDRAMRGEKANPKLVKLADAMREAWDGQRFDWDLLSDEAVAELGIRRRDLRHPQTTPHPDDMPDVYERFFGDTSSSDMRRKQ